MSAADGGRHGDVKAGLTSAGDRTSFQAWISLQNMLNGPHLEIFLKRPITDSSEYVMPMSACRGTEPGLVCVFYKLLVGSEPTSLCWRGHWGEGVPLSSLCELLQLWV